MVTSAPDLVARLRDPTHDLNKCTDACVAAVTTGEVKQLLDEIERLRAALERAGKANRIWDVRDIVREALRGSNG